MKSQGPPRPIKGQSITPSGKPLTNQRIDHYALKGFYGEARRQEWLKGVRKGTIRSLDARIRKGEYGDEARQALKARKKPKKRQRKERVEGPTAEELLAMMGLTPEEP